MRGLLHVSFRPSAALCAAVSFVHLLAMFAAWLSLPPGPALCVTAGLGLSAWVHLRAAALRQADAVARLEWNSRQSTMTIAAPDGQWHKAEPALLAAPVAWFGVAMARSAPNRHWTAIALPDSVEHQSFRRLRVWLRWRLPQKNDAVMK